MAGRNLFASDPAAAPAEAAAEVPRGRNLFAAPDQPVTPAVPAVEPDLLQKSIDVLRGFRDIPQAGAQMIAHALPRSVVEATNNAIAYTNEIPVLGDVQKAIGVVPQTPEEYDQELQAEEQSYQERRKQAGETGVDGTRLGGNIVATAPIAAATGGAGFAPAVAQGAAVSAFQPVTDGGENFAQEKTKQVATGAATGGTLNRVGGAISRVISPNVSDDVKKLIDSGVTPTPGQLLGGAWARTEEKLTSLPLVGDAIKWGQRRAINEFNTAAYNRALNPIGKEAGPEIERSGIEGIKTALGDAYDQLLPKLQFKPDQQFVGELTNLQQMAQQLPAAQANRFEAILQNKVLGKMTPQGNMGGEALKNIESELSRLSKVYKGDPSADQKLLGDALNEVLASIRGNLSRSNPQYASELASINLGYANYARIRDAASRVGAESGVFTPAQLQSAVRAADKSAGKGQFATGNALLQDLSEAGKNVLGSKYPDSGTVGRAAITFGATGAAGVTNPLIALLYASPSLLYTPAGQRATAALLARRPEGANALAELVSQATPAIGAGGAAVAPRLAESR
jgi:hypothetical protein